MVLVEAIDIANRFFQGEANFFTAVRQIPSFTYSKNKVTRQKVTGEEVVNAFKSKYTSDGGDI